MVEDIRVLLVDDDSAFADLTATVLEREHEDFVVVTETSVGDGLDRLREEFIDCVVSDYQMPGTDGLTFLEAVHDDDPDMPFILFTGKGSEEIASEAISRGVADYLQKSAGHEQYELLAHRIRQVVTRRRSVVNYRETFEKVNLGLLIRDLETGELLDVNQRYCEMLGYSRAEVFDLDIDAITADVPGYPPERIETMRQIAVEEGTHTFEWPDQTKDGELLWVEIDLSVATIGGRDRLLASVRDVTERKEREWTLKTQNQRLEDLASVIAPDAHSRLN